MEFLRHLVVVSVFLFGVADSVPYEIQTDISTPDFGKSFTVKCNVIDTANRATRVADNDLVLFKISRKGAGTDTTDFVVKQINRPLVFDQTTSDKYDANTRTLTIDNAKCSDELDGQVRVTYICFASYFLSTNIEEIVNSKVLTIKVPPKAPSFVTTNVLTVDEGDEASFTCKANVGRPDLGYIVWSISIGGNVENIFDKDDARIARPTSQDPGRTCTVIEESKLTIATIGRTYQDIKLSCFVVNNDFHPTPSSPCVDESNGLCAKHPDIKVNHPVKDIIIGPPSDVYEQGTARITCTAEGAYPAATYEWSKVGDENRTLTGEIKGTGSELVLTDLDIAEDSGEYNCTASNDYNNKFFTVSTSYSLTILETTTTSTTVTTPSPPEQNTQASTSPDDDDDTVIIVVVVIVVLLLVIALIIIGFIMYRRRNPKKTIEEPPEKPYNNRTNLSFQNPQPDIVSDEKKFNNPSLNNSFDYNKDGLEYAEYTYDNRPRSRKPMALGDTASEYSDVTMPHV